MTWRPKKLTAKQREERRLEAGRLQGNYLFARSLDGTRDFYVRISATDMTPVEFSRLMHGQNLMILPSSDPPQQGRAWPAKHAMIP